MFVDGLRPRAAWASALAAVFMLASACGVVDDVLASDDSTESAEGETTESAEGETTDTVVFDADVYCALSHEADQLNADFNSFGDPVALEAFFTSLVGLLNQGTPPPQIEAQFITLRTAYVDLQVQLSAAGYDAAVLTTSPILSDANVNAAISVVEEHDLKLCGRAPGVAAPEPEPAEPADQTAGSDPFAEAIASGDFTAMEEILSTEIGRNAFIEGFVNTSPGVTAEQAGCFLDNTDMGVLAEMSVDPGDLSDAAVAEFIASLQACDIPLSAFNTE